MREEWWLVILLVLLAFLVWPRLREEVTSTITYNLEGI